MAKDEDRDAEALVLFVKGMAFKEIAEAMGFSSAQTANNAVKRAISCAAKSGALRIVGESGPEVFVPSEPGTIIPGLGSQSEAMDPDAQD